MADEKQQGWFGVDLDGTLAFHGEWKGPLHIGEPIPAMVEQVKALIANGETVKIFTARIASSVPGLEDLNVKKAIQDWCEKHVGQRLEVTATKDYNTIALFDDRAVQIERNAGVPVVENAMRGLAAAEILFSNLAGCTLTPAALKAANELHAALGLPDSVKLGQVEERRILTR